MASTDIKKKLTVETGEGERSVKSLRQEINNLKDSLLNVEKDGKDWEEIVKQITAAQSDLDAVTKAGKTSIDAASDSIVGMERQYKNLYDTYKLLTEEQRNSDFGKQMANQLDDLSNKLNESKMEVGNYKDNIGRYAQGFVKGFQNMASGAKALQTPLKTAKTAINGVGASLKTLAANPIGAIIMAIVLAFKALKAIAEKVKEAINNNEESQMRLKEAMSAFQPVIDGVKNAFDLLGRSVVSIIEFWSKAFSKLRELRAAFTDFLGVTKGAKEAMQEQNRVYRELAQSQNELIKKEREYKELNAKDKATVERLKEEASEAENNSEKLNLLNQAKEKQAEIDARELELAKERLRQLEVEASLTANDAEMNNKLADAKARVAEVEAQASANARNFNKQINTVNKSIASAAAAAKKEAQKVLDDIEENNKTEIQKLKDKYKKEYDMLKKQHLDTKALTEQYYKDLAKLEAQQEAERVSAIASYNQRVIALQSDNQMKQINSQILDAQKQMKLFQSKFGDDTATAVNGKKKSDVINMAKSIGIEIPDNATQEEIVRLIEVSRKEIQKKIDDLGKAKVQLVGEDTFKMLKDYATAQARDTAEAIDELGDITIENEEERQNKIADLKAKELNEYIGQLEAQLIDFQGTEEQKIQLELEYYNKKEELRQMDLDNAKKANAEELKAEQKKFDKRKDIFDTAIASANLMADVLEQAGDAWMDNINKQVEAGKMSDAEAENQFKKVKALQISVATINMLSGITAALAGLFTTKSGPWDIALAAIQATSIAVAGGFNIAKIANTQLGDTSTASQANTGTSIQTTANVAQTTPYTYSRSLTTEQEEQKMNQPIYVSVTDINDVQNKVKVVEEESTF